MYDVLIAAHSETLIQRLLELHIWGELTGFRVRNILTEDESLLGSLRQSDDLPVLLENEDQLLSHLRQNRYPLVLLEEYGDGRTAALLRTIKNENLCRAVAIMDEAPRFQLVRQAFLGGADDYCVLPFEMSPFIALFSKVENAEHGQLAAEIYHEEELTSLFENADGAVKERLDEMFYRVITEYRDPEEGIAYLQRVTRSVVSTLFEQCAWLENYYDQADYLEAPYEFPGYDQEVRGRLDILYTLFTEFTALCPVHGEQMDPILDYILNNPESDLRQETLARELHINRTYLSTVFSAQVAMSYVEYVNMVRMARAAYLLRHTDRKVVDIATGLDYHDMGHFLKRFRARYGMTPSQYRIPESYNYMI